MRLRNSTAIEIAVLVCALAFGYWIWRGEVAARVDTWYMAMDGAGTERLTPAGWWYAMVSLGVFRFVLYRWYFRLIVWSIFLWRVSRLPLQLNTLHPDRAGGIGFLAGSLETLAPVLFAQTATVAGAIAGHILHEGMKLPAFRVEIGAVIVILMAMVLLPLTFFVLPLAHAGRQGRREYGQFAMRYVDGFREKWIRSASPQAEPLLGTSDIQSLADLGNAYEAVSATGLLPVQGHAVLRVALVIAAPFLPLTLFLVPFDQLFDLVLKKLL
jgi:hypothetical protein